MRARFPVIAACAAGAAAVPFLLAAASDEIQRVLVVNFPDKQVVEGEVEVTSPVPQAALAAVKDVLVSSVGPQDVNHLVRGGVVTTDGFSAVVLSLAGQTRGDVTRPGSVGAILIPDEEPILAVFEEKGIAQFPLEVSASSVSVSTPYFTSSQPRFTVAFPRYQVFFYNTTDKAVTVSLYAYLAN